MMYVFEEAIAMTTINITGLRKNIFGTFEQAIKWGDPVNVITKDGNAMIISEDDYYGLMETLAIEAVPGLGDAIKEGMRTPVDDCIPEDEVSW
jgi:PHD/YefM family antitoxin component YafN of YafNO toxin-antitoxin module